MTSIIVLTPEYEQVAPAGAQPAARARPRRTRRADARGQLQAQRSGDPRLPRRRASSNSCRSSGSTFTRRGRRPHRSTNGAAKDLGGTIRLGHRRSRRLRRLLGLQPPRRDPARAARRTGGPDRHRAVRSNDGPRLQCRSGCRATHRSSCSHTPSRPSAGTSSARSPTTRRPTLLAASRPTRRTGGRVSDRLPGRVAIVTGRRRRNLGKATAQLYAEEGAKVVVADVDEVEGRATVTTIVEAGGDTLYVPTDVGRAADVQRLIATTEDHFGALHIMTAKYQHPRRDALPATDRDQ